MIKIALDESTEWMDWAECAGETAAAMFPTDNDKAGIAYAKSICWRCPVQSECFRYAMDQGEQHGVWGGTTPDERFNIRRNETRRARAAIKAVQP